MRNQLLLTLANIFLATIQTSLLFEFFGLEVSPNLVGALCFGLLLVGKVNLAYESALIGGLVLDIISGGTIGITSFLLTIFVFGYSQLKSFYLQSWISSLLFASVYFYIMRLAIFRELIFSGWLFFGSFLSAVCGYLIWKFLKNYEKEAF